MFLPNKKLFSWIGGKQWMSKELVTVTSKFEFKQYAEPFCGGLGSFLAVAPVLIEKECTSVRLNDINSAMVGTYLHISQGYTKLLAILTDLEQKFTPFLIGSTTDELRGAETYFNQIKREFNSLKKSDPLSVETSARFMFLMFHCFNGIYRENGSGEFNVPFNWKVKGGNLSTLAQWHQFFSQFNIEFTSVDAFDFIDANIHNAPLFYFDPPYANESTGTNKYSKISFGQQEQIALLNQVAGTNSVYSNHDIPFIRDFLVTAQIPYQYLQRANTISSKGTSRSTKKMEILAWHQC